MKTLVIILRWILFPIIFFLATSVAWFLGGFLFAIASDIDSSFFRFIMTGLAFFTYPLYFVACLMSSMIAPHRRVAMFLMMGYLILETFFTIKEFGFSIDNVYLSQLTLATLIISAMAIFDVNPSED